MEQSGEPKNITAKIQSTDFDRGKRKFNREKKVFNK